MNWKTVFLLCCLVAAGLWAKHRFLPKVIQFADAPAQLAVTTLVKDRPVHQTIDCKSKPYLVAYHGASWCPPCQEFSPVLAEFYRTSKHTSFNLIMVNYDHSNEDMEEYLRHYGMAFPAVRVGDAGKWSQATGDGIPNLIIIETATGTVIDSSYAHDSYKGPEEPLETLKLPIAARTKGPAKSG